MPNDYFPNFGFSVNKTKKMKRIIYILGGFSVLALSCKEQGKLQIIAQAEEEAYISDSLPAAQSKSILIEELSGVDCVNCPAGAEKLEEMGAAYPGQIEIVTLHIGSLTRPFPQSTQDLRPDEEAELIKLLGTGNKPSAAFDRRPYSDGNNGSKFLVDGAPFWPANLKKAQEDGAGGTPLNLYVQSKWNESKKRYDIEVTVIYTKEVTTTQALTLYLTESKIIDIQKTPEDPKAEYEFNHTLRKVITPVNGKPILTDLDKKTPGQAYVYRTHVKKDETHPKQKFWKPENMTVVAFVTEMEPNDAHVVHVKSTKLVP